MNNIRRTPSIRPQPRRNDMAPASKNRDPMPALFWGGFFALVLGCWAGLLAVSAAQTIGVPDALRWRAVFDPSLWLALCSAPVRPVEWIFTVPMWALMTIAMMLPSAVPVLRTMSSLPQSRKVAGIQARWWTMVAGYAAVWLGFAVAATGLQVSLSVIGVLNERGASVSGAFNAAMLAVAGLYQFSALKAACLTRCRSPMGFFIAYWQDGIFGAFRMGVRHGLYCLGCCWAIMLLAFVGGMMNLAWMGAAMVLMILEKLPVAGRNVTAPLGVALMIASGLVGLSALAR
jgi:predicted metal-binding membrane protein